MTGNLTVHKITHNQTSVTWKVVQRYSTSTTSLTSPFFSIISDGHLVLFSLTIVWSSTSGYKVTIKQNIPEPGKAILTLSLDRPETASIVRTHLLESWKGDYQLDCSGPALKSIKDSYNQYVTHLDVSFIIKCDITWLGFVDVHEMPKIPHAPKELCLPKMSYANDLQPDVKLIMEGKELPAHKNILALHSPVFLAMFDAPMKESKENKVEVEDVEFTTMETLLKIIYSGETEELDDLQVALKVLAVTEKYQMSIVKTACEYKLQLKLERANILELLDEGDKYNATELLKVCIEYIIAARDIISSKDFEKMCLKRPNLSLTLITTQMEKLWSIPSNAPRGKLTPD